jgi:hypothetical protein
MDAEWNFEEVNRINVKSMANESGTFVYSRFSF